MGAARIVRTMAAILALDQGTTSSRAILFAADGTVLARASRPVPQHYPRPGWVEHDADAIFDGQWAAAVEAHAAGGAPPIAAVGITNQRETVVLIERATGRPLYRAIVWQDRRTADELRRLRATGVADAVAAKTCLPLDPYFSAAKIAWLLDHVPGARAAAERGDVVATTIDAFLVHRLTGGAVTATDASNASRTSLVDLATGDYDDELLRLFRVPRACLPEIRASAGDFGSVAATGWPIRGVLGDQQAALFGQGCHTPGTAKCTYGTGAFLLMQCGTERPIARDGLLATIAWRIGTTLHYASEGSVLVAGALVQWLRDELGLFATSADIEALARSVPDSGDVVVVPAFAGLGTPHWDADARGAILGLTRGTTKAHIARAALEAIALQILDVQRAIERATERAFTELRVDGGAAANRLLLELQASLSGVDVVRPAELETTAVGAMQVARLGLGDTSVLAAAAPGAERIAPMPDRLDRERLERFWAAGVARARGWSRVGAPNG